jgi:hypothetical protein
MLLSVMRAVVAEYVDISAVTVSKILTVTVTTLTATAETISTTVTITTTATVKIMATTAITLFNYYNRRVLHKGD